MESELLLLTKRQFEEVLKKETKEDETPPSGILPVVRFQKNHKGSIKEVGNVKETEWLSALTDRKFVNYQNRSAYWADHWDILPKDMTPKVDNMKPEDLPGIKLYDL